MSELIQKNDNRATIRWKLLTGASAVVLTAYMAAATVAVAEDASQPQVWIELGGQWDRQDGLGHTYTPPFMINNPDSPAFNPVSPLRYEKPRLYGLGESGTITFQPDGSDWQFSASIRYGRSGGRKSASHGNLSDRQVHYTRPGGFHYLSHYPYFSITLVTGYFSKHFVSAAQVQSDQKQSHAVIDFMAGKDVGLGLFGKNVSSTFSAGVRFAQFHSNTKAIIHARPNTDLYYVTNAFLHHLHPSFPVQNPYTDFSTYAAQFRAKREFRGVGPSVSWSASVPIAGDPSNESLSIDWGINAALLFGKQRAQGSHQTSGHHFTGIGKTSGHYSVGGIPFDRSKRVTVPNVGGMLGMSLKFSNFKMSIGYRGDFFFGAMDTGVDTHRTSTTGFYGPFASVSFGLGD